MRIPGFLYLLIVIRGKIYFIRYAEKLQFYTFFYNTLSATRKTRFVIYLDYSNLMFYL